MHQELGIFAILDELEVQRARAGVPDELLLRTLTTLPFVEQASLSGGSSVLFREPAILPFAIRSRSREIALQQIRSHRVAVVAISGAHTALLLDRPQASLPHQALHAMFATADPLCSQLGMDTRAAIDLSALLIRLADLLGQALFLPLALTGFSLAPGVITTFRDGSA